MEAAGYYLPTRMLLSNARWQLLRGHCGENAVKLVVRVGTTGSQQWLVVRRRSLA